VPSVVVVERRLSDLSLTVLQAQGYRSAVSYNRVVIIDLGEIVRGVRSDAAEHGIDLPRFTPRQRPMDFREAVHHASRRVKPFCFNLVTLTVALV